MLYTLKHNGDGGIVKMAQSYCKSDLKDTCLFFVTGDRLCMYDFLRKYGIHRM